MKKSRYPILFALLSLATVLVLATACYREVVPGVTAVPEGEEGAPSSEDQVATAIAEATRAAAAAEAEGEEAPAEGEEVPAETEPEATVPSPTATPEPAPEQASAAEPTAVPPTQAPIPTSAPTSPAATAQPAGQATTGTVVHVVQRGENLFRIALRYGTTVQAVASANGIANPARIYVGQRLAIPTSGAQPAPQPSGGSTYVVQPGDNLFRIALRYGVSYMYLAQYNGIANPAQIRVGQVLRIPPR